MRRNTAGKDGEMKSATGKFICSMAAYVLLCLLFTGTALDGSAQENVESESQPDVSQAAKTIWFRSLKDLEVLNIKISALPGVYEKSLTLSLQIPAQTEVLFALNNEESPAFVKYNQPIRLDSTCNLQCRVVSKGRTLDTLYCGTYIVGRNHVLPIVCLSVVPETFFEPTGIYYGFSENAGGGRISARGNSWNKDEIACYGEFFFNNTLVEDGPFGVKTHGCYTLGHPEKSLQLLAHKKYGKKQLEYRFFSDRPFNEYKSIVIRTSGNEQAETRFKDVLISSVARDMGVDYMAWQAAVVYVNGVYWGIHNLREKVNKNYLNYNHGADPDSTVLLAGAGTSSKDYKELIKYVRDHNQDPDFVSQTVSRMDVDEYFNYQILEIFNANVDSKGNIKFWRAENTDKRFHWIFYDGDCSCGRSYLNNKNFLADRLSPNETAWYNSDFVTVLLRSLVANDEFKNRFINQYCLLLSSVLHPDSLAERVAFFKAIYEPEVPLHVTRRNNVRQESVLFWNSHVRNMTNFYKRMPAQAYEQLKQQFGLGDTVRISLNTSIKGLKGLKINESNMRFEKLNGLFFDKLPLSVEAVNENHLFRFVKWIEDGDTTRIKKLIIKKGLKYTAEFVPKDTSDDAGDLRICRFYSDMQTKKDLHWLEIRNVGCSKKNLEGITVFEDFSHWMYSFGQLTLPANTSIVFSNDTNRFRSQNPGFPGILMQANIFNVFNRQYRFVICDASDRLIEGVEFCISDSLLLQKEHFLVSLRGDSISYQAWNNGKNPIDWDEELFPDCGAGGQFFSSRLFYIILAILIAILGAGSVLIIRRKRNNNRNLA